MSWDDVQRFIRLISFFGSHQYRLPSEAEWEYAARGGKPTARYWGDDIDNGCDYENISDLTGKEQNPDAVVANCKDGYAGRAPVGQKKANPFKLYDMLGNVAQWVEDCFVNNYREMPVDGSPFMSAQCAKRVIRGASSISVPESVLPTTRDPAPPNFLNQFTGFRLVRTIAP